MSASEHEHLESLADVEMGYGEAFDRQYTAYGCLRQVREGVTREGERFVDVQLVDTTAVCSGKIWSDAKTALRNVREIPRGSAVKVLFAVREFRDAVQLSIKNIRPVAAEDEGFDGDRVFGPGRDLVEGLLCETLVFDIETVPAVDLRTVPPTIAQAVARSAERGDGDETKVMSLSPWFGKVVSLGFTDGSSDARSAHVLLVPPEDTDEADLLALPEFVTTVTERELLQAFWQLAAHADLVVTYNGRHFDVPYLVTRSLVYGIPARIDLLGHGLRPHLDLYRILGGRGGPSSLDVVCWGLGMHSPKGDMDGSMVASSYARGELASLAAYNAGDVEATAAVYRKVVEHVLRFRGDW